MGGNDGDGVDGGGSRRLFVAVQPPDHALRALDAALRDETGERPSMVGVRWIDPSRWHMTLQFLGNVPEGRVGDVRLSCAYAAGRVRPFVASFSGVGAFPSRRRARVLWIGVSEGADRLAALATTVQGETAKRGFPQERRDFQAHLTVGRVRGHLDVTELLESVAPSFDGAAPTSEVAEMVLLEAHLGPGGSRYEVVDRFPLQT